MKGSAPVEARDLAWAGRVWDASLGRDCEALYWLASGYPDSAQQFGALMWEHIGPGIQAEVAANLLRLEQALSRARRG